MDNYVGSPSFLRPWRSLLLAAMVLAAAPTVQAVQFDLDYGDGVQGTLNTVITVGGGWRMQDPSAKLIGKSNNNPGVCAGQQSCQGVFRTQSTPAATLAAASGQFSVNGDDGNLNYKKGDMVQGVAKLSQDLTLTYGDFGLFSHWLYFYDVINNDFREFHPNRITSDNYQDVGTPRSGIPPNSPRQKVYGPGGVVRNKRTDDEILRQAGDYFQLLELNVYGSLPLPADHKLSFKAGRQNVNWGESTFLVINSVNQANPLNANNLTRIGFSLDELFIPTNMVFLSADLVDQATVEGFYGLEWKPVEIYTPGTFYSAVDVGTNNAVNNASISFGGVAEDPDRNGFPLDNPLNGITNSTTTLLRLPDREASSTGQYGVALKYYADWLNNGTELSLYYMNYHSKLPYVSFYSANGSCGRKGGIHGTATNGTPGQDIDARTTSEFLSACPDLPFNHPGNEGAATSNALALDSVRFFFEYPENIHMYGFSFNTTYGDYSYQGEVAYRPNLPLQVDIEDLTFAALGPTLTRCHDFNLNNGGACAGTTTNGDSDYVRDNGTQGQDTFDLGVGHMDGSARSFPNFIIPYRGGVVGENPANSYIRGYERFQVYQFNLGATRVLGTTDNWLGADQVILLFELGGQLVPNLPSVDELQIDAPGTYAHASAGADGSGADRSRRACSYDPGGSRREDCSFGPDGLRFNPHQQDPRGYADKSSWGYVIISLIRYESVFPGISFQPTTIFKHDVRGTSVDIANQFIENRKTLNTILEMRYKSDLSFNVGYIWYFGGGMYNLLKDRDTALAFVKYQF